MMNNFYSNIFYKCLIIVIFYSFSYPECLNSIYNFHKDILNKDFFSVKSYFDKSYLNSIFIFIERNKRFKIKFDDRVIIGDHFKISNFNFKTNQLFIENPDTVLNSLLLDKIDENFFNKLNNVNNIYFNNECTSIDSININNQLSVYGLFIDTLSVSNPDSFFTLNVDYEKIFIYDFR